MVLKYDFKGLMAPVFTPFDSKFELNLKEIPKYARILSATSVKGILVNGTVGEGISMTTKERKSLAEAWSKALKNTNFSIMVHVGGTNLKNVCELAKHSENLGVNAILCLADLFFRPATPDDLVKYMQKVSEAAPRTPLLYYHIPSFTGIDVNMKEFCSKACNEVPTFAGVKYSHNNIEEVSQLRTIQEGALSVFLGNDTIIPGALAMGIDSFILTTSNFISSMIEQMVQLKGNDVNGEALLIQRKIQRLIDYVTSEASWISGFKAITSIALGIELGNARPPLKPITKEQLIGFEEAYSQLLK